MNYELANWLKEAGFAQKKSDNNCFYITSSGSVVPYKIWNGAYLPTLSELIEACGDRFHMLIKGIDYPAKQPKYWAYEEYDWDMEQSSGKEGVGQTPEEAVAKLYLALHPN